MSRHRFVAPLFVSALLITAPATAQTPQFRADVSRDGDEPFEGTMYFGNGKMRIEGMSDGQQMTVIVDGGSGSLIMLMPEDRMYITMDMGSAPFSAPAATSMDPADPCSSGEVSDCRSLGSETINGYAARGWEYTRDGERETSWIANDLRFPVRTIEADGTTTDMTNVERGPQPSSLFEPPGDYTAMAMPGFGGGRGGPPAGRGRGQVPPGAGRGAVPPGAGRGAVPPGTAGRGAPAGVPAGVDPAAAAQLTAQLQAMGLPPDQIATALAQLGAMGTATNSAPWEAGDGWVVDLVVTMSGSETGTGGLMNARVTSTYSARYTASVPFPYGTPAVGAAVGPAWQLVPTLGSPRGLAEPLTFSGTRESHSEVDSPAGCPIEEAFRRVSDVRGSVDLRTTDHNSMPMMMAQARWEIAGDLRTHTLMVAVGATGEETTHTTTTYAGTCDVGGAPSTETEDDAREASFEISINLPGLPLAPSPGTMRGTATVPVDGRDGNVEWTLRPIS